ncbi:hypothetical protein B0H17DRAFT_1104299 [Mycena rosella]|uniref:Uncharacterized protein n=1 Tax=Mycena rosella TaxID=1033263 RepID=A0AAD7FYU8_MYCRO|nr:hypothetical protein B0H17DRAFT_1104299 [Mycena rosella]
MRWITPSCSFIRLMSSAIPAGLFRSEGTSVVAMVPAEFGDNSLYQVSKVMERIQVRVSLVSTVGWLGERE